MLRQAPAVVRTQQFINCVREFADTGRLVRHEASSNSSVEPVNATNADLQQGKECSLRLHEIPSITILDEHNGFATGNALMPADHLDPEKPAPPPLPATPESLSRQEATQVKPAYLLPVRDDPVEQVCSTEWGGTFYLINVAIALELYGDFTRPRQLTLPLSVWDFLALVGRSLIGPGLMEDVCWPVLAALSGRVTNEPPGASFVAPRDWRMPDSWLIPFPERSGWMGGIQAGRLRLDHPAGFTVLDAACATGDPVAEFKCECVRLGLAPEAVCPAGDLEDDGVPLVALDVWLDRLVRYVEARLARALNEPDRAALGELVFRRQAVVRCTTDRVTLQFSLEAHSIALRIAGLDRDPGWVPAAGRTITFQYD
jgi:hypothetical protein